MKRLIGRLAAAVTAVILAASMGISSYAAGEGDPDPILYNIKAEEGEEYLELKEAPASEDGEESAKAGSSKEAEPEDKPEDNPEDEASKEESEEEESEEESEDKAPTENASTGTTGSGDASENKEPEKEAPSNKYILVVAIPGDGSYDEFDAIHLTVNYQDAGARTAEIHLDELTPVNTDKGKYYIVRYGLSDTHFKDEEPVTAEGVKVENESPAGTTQDELVEKETKETRKKLTVEFGAVKEKSGEEAASVATTTASTAATTATTEENALSGRIQLDPDRDRRSSTPAGSYRRGNIVIPSFQKEAAGNERLRRTGNSTRHLLGTESC